MKEVYDFITITNKIHTLRFSRYGDEYYALPTVKWIKEQFTPYYSDFLFKNNLRTFKEGANDCDKYALYVRACAHLLYNQKYNSIDGAGLSVGETSYFQSLDLHDINFFVAIDEYGQWVMLFYEPQIQEFVPMDITDTAWMDVIL